MQVADEFERQKNNLLQIGYPQLAGMSEEDFCTLLEELQPKLESDLPDVNIEEGKLPFVIVIKSDLVPTGKAIKQVMKDGKEGIEKLYPHTPDDFKTTENVEVPNSKVYFLMDIDRGKDSLNVTPSDALQNILNNNRSPLTIDEGVAILTHFPEFLMKNNCFSLLASRHPGDKRVPAIWINANKNPNLGWCWDGNPHTWLGSASCARRIA